MFDQIVLVLKDIRNAEREMSRQKKEERLKGRKIEE
jgi:hypothetical protein